MPTTQAGKPVSPCNEPSRPKDTEPTATSDAAETALIDGAGRMLIDQNGNLILRTDPDKGLEAIFQNIGISPREWAMKLLGQEADSTAEAVERFAAAHPDFEELSSDIVFFIESGRADDLAEAYDLAVRFNLSSSETEPVDGERAN
jgi:hypothetical protein